MSEYLTTKALAAVLDRHLTERDEDAGCALRCGYDGDDRAEHLAESLMPAVTRVVDEAVAEAEQTLRERLHALADSWERDNARPQGSGDQVQAGVWSATKHDIEALRAVLAEAPTTEGAPS